MLVKVIVAISENNGIGKDNQLPWKYKDDMRFFSRNTIGAGNNAALMGKNTWLSIGKPLRNRMNIVVSTTLSESQDITVSKSIEGAILLADGASINTLWVIGGYSIYEWFINNKIADELIISKIPGHYECDTFFPEINLELWKETSRYSIGHEGVVVIHHKNINKKQSHNNLT